MDTDRVMMSYQELRQESLPWMLIPLIISAFAVAIQMAEPPTPAAMGVLLLSLSVLVWSLRRRHQIAAWSFVLGTLGLILLAWYWFPGSDIQSALLFPVIGAAITLGFTACVITAGLASLALIFGAFQPEFWHLSPYALVANLAILWSTTYLLYIAQRPQKTLLAWAWEGYEQARRALETARDRQVELKQALADLTLANGQTVRLNELLSAARKAVDEARKAKEEFVANVSHELRTPLNMIIGFSDMILETPQVYSRRLPASLLADAAAIKRNSQHLANLVDDVLDLAEVDTGRMQLFKEWTSLSEVIGEATEAVAALFKQKGLDLKADVPTDLPALYCDRTRIRQVILNLLSNAGRFTERGGAQVRVTIRDQEVLISVADTGTGMDPQNISRLFEPFQQADQSIRRRYGGSGLGLTISKRFVEMHGGRIWIESQVGTGTTAFFTLPISQNLAEDSAKRWFGPYQEYTPRTRPSVAPIVSPKSRVVVVEEGDSLRRLMERYLEDVELIGVATVEEAGQAVESNAAKALVINQATPMLRPANRPELSAMAFDIPIISCWVPEFRAAISRMGAQEYLVKPVRRPDLLGSIGRVTPEARLILLVDDDPEARQLFGRMLASAEQNYTVLYAADGNAALRLLRERRPDVMLLDLVMPNLDGFAVLETQTQEPSIAAIPVVIISAKDPHREPIVTQALTLTRQEGLSARDLMRAISALARALEPRIGAPTQPETPGVSPAC